MAAIKDTGLTGTITWLGVVRDRDAGLPSQPVDTLPLTFAGPEGEMHGGLTRPSCSRVMMLYPRDTEIANVRQLSVLSAAELAQIATALGLPALDPALVGATVVIAGLPDLTHLPPSSRLQAAGGATLVVDMSNLPCQLPARPIETAHPGHGARFKSAAAGRRGITAWVERPGTLTLGETVRLFIPAQRAWTGAEGGTR